MIRRIDDEFRARLAAAEKQWVTDEQLSDWESNPCYFGTREFVRAVCAELRAFRALRNPPAAVSDVT